MAPNSSMLDPGFYQTQVSSTLEKLETAFKELVLENDKGWVEIKSCDDTSLVVSIKSIGDYTFTSDSGSQTFSLQSPQSGIHNYRFDTANGFWKSMQQEHILEELLVREFIMHSKGMLNL